MSVQPVLIDGEWRTSRGSETFTASNPGLETRLPEQYPVSPWDEVESCLAAAARASRDMRGWSADRYAEFLERYADRLDQIADALVEIAAAETALPAAPRLKDVELPRTTNQLRQAAAAARDEGWSDPTIDTAANIRSMLGPVGPVIIFGPNNFPFAFNGIAGGDFAAAVAAGNPVIAKGHSSHPGTTRLMAVEAQAAAEETGMPAGFVQLIYRTSHSDGARMVAHPTVGAVAYTGSRQAGLVIKAAADRVGTPAYLELSSINPVFILPGALSERLEALAEEFTTSCLMGTGQFCTNPGLVVLLKSAQSDAFLKSVATRFHDAPVGTMLSTGVRQNFEQGIKQLLAAGAVLETGGQTGGGTGVSFHNTLLSTSGAAFLGAPEQMQTEAFGNSSLFVVADDPQQMQAVADALEGNLTGSIYSDSKGADDPLYDRVAAVLRERVGRLLNDKMPTGVAVSVAMNHGGPFPATGHPGFTAVGMPSSIRRFSSLWCYDGVRQHRLPAALQDKNPSGTLWRSVDGDRTQADVTNDA
ncbi:MAG: aldehyde dehydrogenase (NADP(+)) [Planctomycetaceae bacterium]